MNFLSNIFRLSLDNKSKKDSLIKLTYLVSISVVITWLVVEMLTTSIINRSFTGRSLSIQLTIFSGITLFISLVIFLIYRFYQTAHQKNKLFITFSLLQIFLLLISYLTILFNFNRWFHDITVFILLFLVNLLIFTILFFKQHFQKTATEIQLSRKAIIFVFVILIFFILEIFIFNPEFFSMTFQNLPEIQYEIRDGSLFGFSLINGGLKAEHNDPNINFSNIDEYVHHVKIRCTNPNPDALSQVFYRTEFEDYTEEKSITFPLSNDATIISLPRAIKVSSLRFDLTNV